MSKAGFRGLQTEPCGWVLEEETSAGVKEIVGIACAHVDDFLFAGESTSLKWQSSVEYIYSAYQWSPWEADNFMQMEGFSSNILSIVLGLSRSM